MTERGVSASQEMRAIQLAGAVQEATAAQARVDELRGWGEYESALWWIAVLAPWCSSTRTPIQPPTVPVQRTVASWMATRRAHTRAREMELALERKWRG